VNFHILCVQNVYHWLTHMPAEVFHSIVNGKADQVNWSAIVYGIGK